MKLAILLFCVLLGNSYLVAQTNKRFVPYGAVDFQLIQGRLCLYSPRHRKGSENINNEEVSESITVTAQGGIPNLHFTHTNHKKLRNVVLNVIRAKHIEIKSNINGERCLLSQPPKGIITLKCGDQVWQGQTLLHLRESNRAMFDKHIDYVLKMVWGKSFPDICDKTRDYVIKLKETETINEDVTILVYGLQSTKKSTRTKAEKELIKMGISIVPLLQEMRNLDPEQKYRVNKIIEGFRGLEDDTPRSLAHLLMKNKHYLELIK